MVDVSGRLDTLLPTTFVKDVSKLLSKSFHDISPLVLDFNFVLSDPVSPWDVVEKKNRMQQEEENMGPRLLIYIHVEALLRLVVAFRGFILPFQSPYSFQ